MADSIASVTADASRAIGEVASLRGGLIDVFVYPERYRDVGSGSILVVRSEGYFPIGIVIKLVHESRLGSFTPLRRTREEIRRAYPDILEYSRFVATMAYTSYFDGSELRHIRGSSPLLHDLVFVLSGDDVSLFLKPSGGWDFGFLRYFLAEGASPLELRDFLYRHEGFFRESADELDDVVSSIMRALISAGASEEYLSEVISFFSRLMG